MKKILAVILSLTVLLLAGCGLVRNTAADPTVEPPAASAQPAEQTPPEAPAESTDGEPAEAPAEVPEEPAELPEELPEEPEDEPAADELTPIAAFPQNMASVFYFSSGAGAWATELILSPDGSFSGTFHDTDMGDIGEGYPNGTIYLCGFRGRFTVLYHPDETSWVLKMDQLEQEQTDGESWIEDGVRYVGSYPYGLDGGVDYILYAPERPVEGLSEELISWWPGRWNPDGVPETLECWGIESVDAGYGFFSYD